jgi:hypothetical protein
VGSAVRGLLSDPRARESAAAAGRVRASEWADGAATARWWQAAYAKVARPT